MTPRRAIGPRSIVWANGPDRWGQNWKYRPWVVLADPVAGTVTVLSFGVTSDLAFTPTEFSVRLPSAPDGHPRTGLRVPSTVVCNWPYELPVAQIEDVSGVVPPEEWERILRVVDALP